MGTINIPMLSPMAWFIAFIAVLAPFNAAHAGYYAKCEIYVASSLQIPRPVASLMRERSDTAAYACFDYGGQLGVYRPVTEVRENAGHVCSFQILPVVFPISVRREPEIRMALSGQTGCPPRSTSSYVWVNNVSEGEFVEIVRFVDRLCLNSDGKFRPFISSAAPEATSIAKQLQSFCGSVSSSRRGARERLFSVSRDKSGPSSGSNSYSSFLMQFEDAGQEEAVWSVRVNFQQGAIKVDSAELDTHMME